MSTKKPAVGASKINLKPKERNDDKDEGDLYMKMKNLESELEML